MKDAQTKEINGHSYTVSPLMGRRALRLQMKLAERLLPGVTQLMGALKGGMRSILDGKLDADALSRGAEKLLSGLRSPVEAADLLIEIISGVRRDGTEITPKTFDVLFQAALLDAYKVAAFVVEVNYGDFFGEAGIGSLGELLKDETASSPPESPAP